MRGEEHNKERELAQKRLEIAMDIVPELKNIVVEDELLEQQRFAEEQLRFNFLVRVASKHNIAVDHLASPLCEYCDRAHAVESVDIDLTESAISSWIETLASPVRIYTSYASGDKSRARLRGCFRPAPPLIRLARASK